ncbi:oocyte zinc finger protein XlCOF6-like [Rhopalosiphum maidis]|uniref:oocyte zinc finger protein XlCOF6-like n=1 Tax=Rhopalosiphum maidis TaxID=43146 RepID=UPI000F00FF28|nr:oocyte zinc finger protein XlCOF6-like [Rhopalosiphum maidis]
MKNKFDLDFNVLCRLCLHKGPELRPIFDCDFSYRIESCVGIVIRQCDRGPAHMCVNCQSNLENWEEFKQKCISSNECIQNCIKQLEEEKLNLTVDNSIKLEDQLEIDEQESNHDSTLNNEFNNQDSDNDSSKSKSPILPITREVYSRAVKKEVKAFDNKTSNKKKHYECGMCSIDFTEKETLYNHLIDFHKLEENNTPHYCLICNKGYCNYTIYQNHLTAEQDIHGSIQIQDKVKDCTIGCGLCTCKFSRSTSLYRHLRNHALKKDLMPHLCSFCQVGFLDTYSLYLHASTEHHAASVIVNESKKESSDVSTILNQGEELCVKTMATNTVSGEYKDNNYTITTKRKIKKLKTLEDKRAKYREHYRRFQSKTYACEFCNVAYSRFCDLFNHDRTAHDDMPKEFSCPTCGKLFLTNNRLQIHQNAFHAEKAFSCDVCNVRCKSKHTLRTHMRKHSGVFACSHCGLTTASNAALVSHMRIHTGEKPFVCDLCGNSYASKLGLTSHKRTHQQEALFKCNVCGYTGSSHSSIYIHRQTHNSDKPFVCDVCGKTFKIKVRLVDHQKIHFASKDYVCEVCNKAFLARYQLVQHSRTHSGEKPFQCHLCAKAFARRDGLSEHIRTHTGEKRYTCTECFRTFSFYKSMKNHKCSATVVGGVDDDVNDSVDADNVRCNRVESMMDPSPSTSLQMSTEDNGSLDPSYQPTIETNGSSSVPSFPDSCSLPTSWTPS